MELRKLEKSARLQLQDLLDEQNTPEPQNIPNPQGRPPKPVGLSQLSHRQQSRVTGGLIAEVDRVLGEYQSTTVQQVLGVVIRRLMYHDDRALAGVGIALLDGQPVRARRKLSPEQCLHLITHHKLRERGWT